MPAAPYEGTTSNQFNSTPVKGATNNVNQAAYQQSLITSTPSQPVDVTGVVLNFAGLTLDQLSMPGARNLVFTASGTLLAWDGGAGVNVGAGGTFTLVGADGRKVKAVVTALSLPAGNESDIIVVSRPMGMDDKAVRYADGNMRQFMQSVPAVDPARTIPGTIMLGSMDVNTNRITKQPTDITGVTLSIDGIALTSQLIPGLHSLAFTASGTLLAVDGGTGVNVGAGGTFTLTAPNGKTVKAIVVAASLPVGDEADADITVTDFPTSSKVVNDPSFRNSVAATYAAL